MIKTNGPKRVLFAALSLLFATVVILMGISLQSPGWATKAMPSHVVSEEIILMPDRVIAPPRTTRPVTMKDYDVHVAIKDNMATTTIEQTFTNNTSRNVQARYLYPLPEDANFSSFSITINGQPVEGKIMEKEEARRTYFNIVQKLIDPGLLEYVDNKTVQVSVAPIAPGESKKIRLSYTQLLKQDGGLYKYQYPFGFKATESIPVNRANLEVSLDTTASLKTIYSPTHAPKVERQGDKKARVALDLKTQKALMEKNFVLYFSQDNQMISLNSLTFKEPTDESGFFLMTIRAPQELKNRKPLPKNVILVLDTSGSMSGGKIVQAKEALKYIVTQLRPSDSFSVVQFNTDVSVFRREPVAATAANKQAALDYVGDLDANGSTHIEGALKTAFSLAPKSTTNRPSYVIFLTDGEPTVGITDTEGLLQVAREANTQNARLFNFGVGYDVKTDLLGKLADAHHGSTTYVEPNENLELALTSFYNKIDTPVLTDVRVDFGPLEVSKVYPAEVGDLFAGSEVILLGRFKQGGSGQVTISGKMGDQLRRFSYPVNWEPKQATRHAQLPRLWAGRRIGYLLDSIHQNGEHPEVKSEVVALSKQYGIITPYTSFLALEPSEEGGVRYDISPQGNTAAAPMGDISGYRTSKGKGAVQLQKSLSAMKMQASSAQMAEAQNAGMPPGAAIGVQAVGSKTFVLSKDGVWTDSDYDASKHGKPETLTFGSPEYFKLVTKKPQLARFFSLGQKVLVLFEGKAYQVVPAQAG